jgi:hypothetical protein
LCVCRFPPHTAAAASQSYLATTSSKTELSLNLRGTACLADGMSLVHSYQFQ